MNFLKPDLMSDAERLDEVAEILAQGVIRLRQRHDRHPSTLSREPGDNWLDFRPNQRGHAGPRRDGDR